MSDRPGIIYAVSNPAWPTWVKVGRSEGSRSDAENVMKRRLYQYNTGDPDKAYKSVLWEYAACCHTAERYAHDFLDATSFRGHGEWYQQREDFVESYIAEAARIARLRPPLRSQNYNVFFTKLREELKDGLLEIVTEELQAVPSRSSTAAMARDSHQVIQHLLECMAMPDENLEAAARAVQRRLTLLGAS